MVSQGSANSQIPELNNSDVYFGSLCPPPKDLTQDRRWRIAWSMHSLMCLEHDRESLVHLFPFWDVYQRLKEKSLQKGPVLRMRLAVVPPGGRLLMELVLGGNFAVVKRMDRIPERGKSRPRGTQPGRVGAWTEGRPPSHQGRPVTVVSVLPRSFLDP